MILRREFITLVGGAAAAYSRRGRNRLTARSGSGSCLLAHPPTLTTGRSWRHFGKACVKLA